MSNVKKMFKVSGGRVAELQSGKVAKWQSGKNASRVTNAPRTTQYAILISLFLALTTAAPAHASDLCAASVIAQPVCDMDSFYGELPRQIPDGWAPFVLFGDPQFVNDPHSLFGSGTLRIMSNNSSPLKAGIYTQVQVNPGAGYRASVAWAAPNFPTDAWGRQLGIDPTGGTDPNSPTVIWGPTHYGDGRLLNYPIGEGPNIDVLARAVNGTITVFFLADLTRSEGANLIYVDVIGLYPDENAPAAVTVPPTNTPAPTDTPQAAQPPPAAQEQRSADANLVASSGVQSAPAAPLEIFVGTIDTPTSLPTDTPIGAQALIEQVPVQQAIDTPAITAADLQAPVALAASAQIEVANPTATWTPWPTSAPVSAFSVMGSATTLLSATNNDTGLVQRLLMTGVLGLAGSLVSGGLLWLMRRK